MSRPPDCTRRPLPRVGCWRLHAVAALLTLLPRPLAAQVVVPGTGQKVAQVGDDFEDPKWSYIFNLPKSSEENDKQQRLPGGLSRNGRWFEGAKRGQPDVIERVATPEGGLPESQGSLLLRSQQTGVPGQYSGHFQQDDLILDASRMGGGISVARSPSCVVRVYLPPWDQWERRFGPSFGIRAGCQAYQTKQTGRLFRGSRTSLEPYWPGFFVQFVPGDGKDKKDYAYLTLRAGPQGQDLTGPKITEPGWWTFGMSFSLNGEVHYFLPCRRGGPDRGRSRDVAKPVWTALREIRHAVLQRGQRRQRRLVDALDHRRSHAVRGWPASRRRWADDAGSIATGLSISIDARMAAPANVQGLSASFAAIRRTPWPSPPRARVVASPGR
jgi:hypothetical protein